VRSVGQRKCFAAQGNKTPESGPAENIYASSGFPG